MTSWLLESLKSTHFSTFVSNMLWWNRSFLMFRHVFLTRQALAQFMAGKCRSELLNLRHAGVTAEVAQVHRGSRFWQRLGYHKSWEKCDLMGTTWQTYVFFEWLAIFKMKKILLDEHRRFWSELESEMVWEGRSLVIFSSEYSGVSFYPLKSPHVERHHQIITPENGPGCMHLNVLIWMRKTKYRPELKFETPRLSGNVGLCNNAAGGAPGRVAQ